MQPVIKAGIVCAMILMLMIFAFPGCQKKITGSYNPPEDHTLSKGGSLHKPGLQSPQANCTECHGEDLRGGTAVVSCYECHGKKW